MLHVVRNPCRSQSEQLLFPAGNEAYAEGFKTGEDSQLKMLRVVNIPDIVPKVLAALQVFSCRACMPLTGCHPCSCHTTPGRGGMR